MQPYVIVKEKMYRTKIKTRMKVFSLITAVKAVKLNISKFIRLQTRSLKSRIVITFKTLKAMFQLFQFLEKLIKETEKAKEKLINMEVRTSQLYQSFNYLYANLHKLSQQTGISVPELDMNKLPTRQMLGL